MVIDNPELTALKAKVLCLLQTRDPRLSLHDFRMVPGKKHMNLVFDVALPRDMKDRGEELRSWVEDTLNAEGEMVYHVIITFDVADFV